MKLLFRLGVVLVLAAAVVAVVVVKTQRQPDPVAPNTAGTVGDPAPATAQVALPRLVDLGSHTCIPCKKMAPILEELRKEYAGRMHVEFIDVWKNPDAGKAYGIEMIPTQIFYDANGTELFRHTGFFGKEDILGKWKELGVELAAAEKK